LEIGDLDISGGEVFRWLVNVPLSDAASVLIGCELDDGEADELLPIVGVNAERKCLVVELGYKRKHVPLRNLREGMVVDDRPGTPLRHEIDASKTPAQQQLENAQHRLREFNINPAKIGNSDDVYVICDALEDYRDETIPNKNQRDERHGALKRADLNRIGAKIADQWYKGSSAVGEVIESDICIKLTYFLRHSGQLDKALTITNAIEQQSSMFKLSPNEKSVLATMRAAILLDLYEVHGDGDLLIQARKFSGMAWAISQSDEVSMVYNRLNKLEGNFNR
jgi:hypothetical protein